MPGVPVGALIDKDAFESGIVELTHIQLLPMHTVGLVLLAPSMIRCAVVDVTTAMSLGRDPVKIWFETRELAKLIDMSGWTSYSLEIFFKTFLKTFLENKKRIGLGPEDRVRGPEDYRQYSSTTRQTDNPSNHEFIRSSGTGQLSLISRCRSQSP
jgi:hypothetical protein